MSDYYNCEGQSYIRNNPVLCCMPYPCGAARTTLSFMTTTMTRSDGDEDKDDDRGLSPRGSGEVRRRYCYCTQLRIKGERGANGRMIARQFFHLFLFLFVISDSAYIISSGGQERAGAGAGGCVNGRWALALDWNALLRQQSGSWRKTVAPPPPSPSD